MDYNKYFEKAILIREVENKLLDLYKIGKLNGTVHTCIGQEFTGVSISDSLTREDFIVSNHRGHGHYISRTGDLKGLFCEVMGKKDGCAGGIGGSQHFYNKNYLSNGIQGGMTPIAAGVALSKKLKNEDGISLAYIGDGTLGEGILYETLNICSIWNLPMAFVLENNKIAQSTDWRQTVSGTIEGRASAFDIKFFKTKTNDIDHLFPTVQDALDYCRENKEPIFLEIETNRLHSHSKSGDNRAEEKVKKLHEQDPINEFKEKHPDKYEEIKGKVKEQINKAVDFADNSPKLSKFEEGRTYTKKSVEYSELVNNENIRGNYAIYTTLKKKFSESSKYIIIGEDIESSNEYNPGEYGGAFKVTKDLSELFPGRVRNTPISEAAITGVGTGLALNGHLPLVEIMFGDFATLIFDQIVQHASKFELMYNGEVDVPLIVRTPMGGHRGYGPTHSQSLEKHFLGIPNLDVLALNHRINPSNIYENLLGSDHGPTLVIENKIVYTEKVHNSEISGYIFQETNEKYPTIKISTEIEDPDCTILCYGGALIEVEEALGPLFDKDEIICEVICPTKINPTNLYPIIESVRKTEKVLVVEEGPSVASWGSEILARLSENEIKLKKVLRLSNDTIIPCSLEAEKDLLPTADSIVRKVKNLVFEYA